MVKADASAVSGALLAVDVGNTNTVLGLYDGETLMHHWRLTTRRDATSDELALSVEGLLRSSKTEAKPRDVIVANVVPSLKFPMRQAFRQVFGQEPLFVEPGVKTGMPILYEVPQEVGADRIVNAVAAFARLGGPCIVVDFGTATTFDVVTARGEYSGGVIVPGITISAEALFERAAQALARRDPPAREGRRQDHGLVDPVRALFRIPLARGWRHRPDRARDRRKAAGHRDGGSGRALRRRVRAYRGGGPNPDSDGLAFDP